MIKKLKKLLSFIFVDGLSGMALGLFSTLIIGLIIKQLGDAIGGDIGNTIYKFGEIASIATGAGIGLGVAHKFKAPSFVIYSSAVTGLIGAYASTINSGAIFEAGGVTFSGPGEPLGAFIAVLVGYAFGKIVSGRTKVDLIIVPLVTIITGGLAGLFVGPPISTFMNGLGEFINWATVQSPLIMGIVIAVVMGMALTLPISSAALSIILGLSGIAAGAATVGCSVQMVGFAVTSYKENGSGGLLAQGLGTSMLQIPNIVKKPIIWLPTIITSAILGPVSTVILKLENNSAGAGMGTSGLVGQLNTWSVMSELGTYSSSVLFIIIVMMHFVLPGLITFIIYRYMKKKKWIKDGDMKLDI